MRMVLLLLCFIPSLLFAQGKKIKAIKTTSGIVQATMDRAGDFYVTLKTGEIQKYDKQGEFLNSFHYKGIPTLFDPTNAIRLLVYYHELKEYAWLSPNLEVSSFLKIDPSFAIEPALLCPSGERDLWILDAADFSMKKVNQQDSKIVTEFLVKSDVIPNALAVTSIREYQNVLFLFDQKRGIAIYNNFGKPIRFIDSKNIPGYNFLGEELYFIEEGKIKFLDLFTGEKSELVLQDNADLVVLSDERMVLIKNDQIDVYEFQPSK